MDKLTELAGKYKISIGTLLALIPILWSAWSFADGYFAHTADVKEVVQEIQDMKKSTLDDKIFELEFKQQNTPKLFTPLDSALLSRYKRQLKDYRDK